MRTAIATFTAFSLLLHAWLGCCAHHGHVDSAHGNGGHAKGAHRESCAEPIATCLASASEVSSTGDCCHREPFQDGAAAQHAADQHPAAQLAADQLAADQEKAPAPSCPAGRCSEISCSFGVATKTISPSPGVQPIAIARLGAIERCGEREAFSRQFDDRTAMPLRRHLFYQILLI